MPQYICLFSNFGNLNLRGGELGKKKKKEREKEKKCMLHPVYHLPILSLVSCRKAQYFFLFNEKTENIDLSKRSRTAI